MVTLHILQEIAKKGYHVRLVNHEMGDYDTANRSIAMLTDINPDLLRRGVLTEGQEMEVERLLQEELTNLKLDIRYMGNARIESIVTETMLACKRGKCDMLAVDYLQLISAPVEKGGTADEAIGRNINALKDLAVRCNIPVIVVSQMNREIEHRGDKAKIPVLSDLRNSGVIEQTSDVVMFVYRPDRLGITKDQDTDEIWGVSPSCCSLKTETEASAMQTSGTIKHLPNYGILSLSIKRNLKFNKSIRTNEKAL